MKHLPSEPPDNICRCKWDDQSYRNCHLCEEVICDCTAADHKCVVTAEVELQITKQGGVLMLHSDYVDLTDLGKPMIKRASNIEFDNSKQRWFVQSAASGKILRDDFMTRNEALQWEAHYYSPSGDGWKEFS